MGQNTGGFGLWLTTRDIALFGQLLLQDGLWEGRQLLPEGWVQEATSEQISTDASRQGEWAQGYGYQFWRCQNGYYRGDGMMGQICWVLQAQDAVIAITAAAEDMGKEMELLQEHLIPAIDAPGADEAVQQALVARIKALSHPITLGGGALPAGIAGTYVAEDGAGITVSVEGDVLALALFSKELPMPFTLRFGAAELYNGDLTIPMPMPQRMACQAGYRYEDGILTVMLRALGSPLSFKAVFKVAPDGLTGAIGGWPFTREEQTYRRA